MQNLNKYIYTKQINEKISERENLNDANIKNDLYLIEDLSYVEKLKYLKNEEITNNDEIIENTKRNTERISHLTSKERNKRNKSKITIKVNHDNNQINNNIDDKDEKYLIDSNVNVINVNKTIKKRLKRFLQIIIINIEKKMKRVI